MEDTNAQVRLVVNGEQSSHLAEVSAMFSGAQEIGISVAYLKTSGLALLKAELGQTNRGSRLSVFVGTSQYITEPEALKSLLRMVKIRSGSEAFLVHGNDTTFHPKLYYARAQQTATALIGSANATRGGFKTNIEASVLVTFPRGSPMSEQIRSFLAALKISPTTTSMDAMTIAQYESRHQVFARRRKEAEDAAENELSDRFELDEPLLKRFLSEYLADSEEQEKWREKAQKYAEAKRVLDRLGHLRQPTQREFLEPYGMLVGTRGGQKLWASGSIFRSKNQVARQRNQMTSLVRTLRKLAGEPPEVIYAEALRQARSIHGLGPNIVTEILTTYRPQRYAVLNNNPLGSIRELGFPRFPAPSSFTPELYAEYCELLTEIGGKCSLKSLTHVDHFMNFIYWKYVRGRPG